MRFISLDSPSLLFQPYPKALNFPSEWFNTVAKRRRELALKTTHKELSDYINSHRDWGKLKDWLSNFSNAKCWYCEGDSARAPCDVDHFRPKLGVTINYAELIDHEGYYWLAYDWTNFRYSCQRCNRPEKDELLVSRGKHNEFPIKDEANRCVSQSGTITIDFEEPTLLDPCVRADVNLLSYGIDGEVKPAAAIGTWGYTRADYTIKTLGFNSYNIPEKRRKKWRRVDDLISLSEMQGSSGPMRSIVENDIKDHINIGSEHSSFYRAVIGTHKKKKWVNEILKEY